MNDTDLVWDYSMLAWWWMVFVPVPVLTWPLRQRSAVLMVLLWIVYSGSEVNIAGELGSARWNKWKECGSERVWATKDVHGCQMARDIRNHEWQRTLHALELVAMSSSKLAKASSILTWETAWKQQYTLHMSRPPSNVLRVSWLVRTRPAEASSLYSSPWPS